MAAWPRVWRRTQSRRRHLAPRSAAPARRAARRERDATSAPPRRPQARAPEHRAPRDGAGRAEPRAASVPSNAGARAADASAPPRSRDAGGRRGAARRRRQRRRVDEQPTSSASGAARCGVRRGGSAGRRPDRAIARCRDRARRRRPRTASYVATRIDYRRTTPATTIRGATARSASATSTTRPGAGARLLRLVRLRLRLRRLRVSGGYGRRHGLRHRIVKLKVQAARRRGVGRWLLRRHRRRFRRHLPGAQAR